MPAATCKLVCRITALDGTWHRPFTTLELVALQSLVDPEEYLELEGLSDSDWRERIGNAVPPDAAEAIAGVMGTTLLLAMAGEIWPTSRAASAPGNTRTRRGSRVTPKPWSMHGRCWLMRTAARPSASIAGNRSE